MEIPVQVSFRHLDYSPFIASAVRKKVEKLERFYPRITSVRVMVELSQRRRQQGNLYHVRVDITVPGKEIVVGRDPSKRQAHQDVYVAIRDAFDAARRRLEDHVRIRFRGKVRHHERPLHATVVKIFPGEDYGFLRAEDGREIYFHRNSVLNQEFDVLRVGDEVQFAESPGEKGPQASTVKVA
jgi:ribosomal subunit interface protein